MKALVVGVALLAIVFLIALLAPGPSRKLQSWIRSYLRRGERKSGDRGGRVGDWTARSLGGVRHATDRSAEAGRDAHNKARRKL